MPLWIYIVAPVGIATIVVVVVWLFGGDTAQIKDETELRRHLETKLKDGSGFTEFLFNRQHTMAWAIHPQKRCLAVVYAHGIHINVEPIAASHFRGCRLQKTGQDEITLSVHTDSFDRPTFRLQLPASQEWVAQHWQQQMQQLFANEVLS